MLRVGDYNQLQFGRENLELKSWLGRDSYETWEKQFNIFIKSLIRIDIPDYKSFADSIRYKLDTKEYNRSKEYIFSIRSIREKREERNFYFLERLDHSVQRDTFVWRSLNDTLTDEVLFQLYSNDSHRVLSVAPVRSIDEDCCVLTKFLDDLEETFHVPWYPIDYDDWNVRKDVFEDAESYRISILKDIAKVRNGISRKDESVYNDLWILAGHVSVCMYIQFEGYYEKKKQLLTDILADLIRIRAEGKASKYVMNRVDKNVVQKIAKKYIDTEWMHTRWLTNYILEHLLDAEIDYPTYIGRYF